MSDRNEPRTEAGRALRDILYVYTGSKSVQQAIMARILRIEAEAAQGAAPRAEGLQPDTPASQFADRLAEALDKEWDAFLIEGESSLNFGDYAERVAVRLSRPSDEREGESDDR